MKKETALERVRQILSTVPEARNSDKLLMVTYWDNFDQVNIKNGKISVDDFFSKATPAESLTRARRMIQSKGEFLPTDEAVIEQRKLRETKMKRAVLRGEVI